MTSRTQGQEQNAAWTYDIKLRRATFALVLVLAFTTVLVVAPSGCAQTFQVLYNFPSYGEGWGPGGLVADRAGNFYGVMGQGLYGGVFKFSREGTGWIFSDLYRFQGAPDGSDPTGIVVASDGSLYGVAGSGGTGPCERDTYSGCGIVFRLQPPATPCKSIRCPWTETILYSFQGTPDLQYPGAEPTFDQVGNLYGTASAGGTSGNGGVFRMAPSQGGWTYGIMYSFNGTPDGANPEGSVTLDQAGNVYGPTFWGGTGSLPGCEGHGCGTVYQLSPSGSGWTEAVLHSFGTTGSDGEAPFAGLLRDSAGNLYGTTVGGGSNNGSTVFEFSPSNGSFTFSVLYTLPSNDTYSESRLVMDPAGNLYGTTVEGGMYGYGTVFKLSPGSGGWTFTDLHDFDFHDGFGPAGDLVLDAGGNLYGTAYEGGTNNEGVIWEITP